MTINNAKIEMTYGEVQALIESRTCAEKENAELRKQLQDFKIGPIGSQVASLTEFSRKALTIARYAIANLPPAMHPKWPASELEWICKNISVLPDVTVDEKDMALDLLNFVEEIYEHETRRAGERTSAKVERVKLEFVVPEASTNG